MRSLALALCVAVLGTGCIIHDDDDDDGYYYGSVGDVNVYWEFIRNAPAQTNGYVVYDASLTGTATGACPDSAVEWVRVTSTAGTYDADCQTWNAADGVSVQGITIGNLPEGTQTVRVRGYRGSVVVHDSSVTVDVFASDVVDAVVSVEPVQASAELYADLAWGTTTPPSYYASCADAGYPNVSYALYDGFGTLVAEDLVGCEDPLPTFVYGDQLDLDNYTVRMQGIATSGASTGQVVFDSCGVDFDHFSTQTGTNGVAVNLLTNPVPSCG
jgi:hypothetical protein